MRVSSRHGKQGGETADLFIKPLQLYRSLKKSVKLCFGEKSQDKMSG